MRRRREDVGDHKTRAIIAIEDPGEPCWSCCPGSERESEVSGSSSRAAAVFGERGSASDFLFFHNFYMIFHL
jgi:hypothetical protein